MILSWHGREDGWGEREEVAGEERMEEVAG